MGGMIQIDFSFFEQWGQCHSGIFKPILAVMKARKAPEDFSLSSYEFLNVLMVLKSVSASLIV
jgi:hypothetical protein